MKIAVNCQLSAVFFSTNRLFQYGQFQERPIRQTLIFFPSEQQKRQDFPPLFPLVFSPRKQIHSFSHGSNRTGQQTDQIAGALEISPAALLHPKRRPLPSRVPAGVYLHNHRHFCPFFTCKNALTLQIRQFFQLQRTERFRTRFVKGAVSKRSMRVPQLVKHLIHPAYQIKNPAKQSAIRQLWIVNSAGKSGRFD